MLLRSVRSILEPIVDDAIAREVTPGAVVLVCDAGKIVCHEAFGWTASPDEGGIPVEPDTIYDAASLTKSVVTSCLLMQLVSEGQIGLETPVAPLLAELQGTGASAAGKEAITLGHLLGHASGLPAHLHFYEQIRAGERAGTGHVRDALAMMAGQTALTYPTGSKTIYSDLGYILLARLIETLGGARLDAIFAERIAGPLGMPDSGFVDLLAHQHPQMHRVAPTKQIDTRLLLRGEVHDDNCHAGGGISGHAGLFSTAPDLARLALTLCKVYGGQNDFVDPAVLRSFWTRAAAPETSWRMGWDTPSGEIGASHAGDHWPASGVGHLGYTGTAWWLAPQSQRAVIILTNRVYYSCEKEGIKALRRSLMHAIGDALPAL
jgi:CubicO group peptidase (beta-lactamase class C family)